MAKRSGTKHVNGFLLELLIEKSTLKRSDIYSEKGVGGVSRGTLESMINESDSNFDVKKIKIVAAKLKEEIWSLEVEDLYKESRQTLEQILERERNHRLLDNPAHPWVRTGKQKMMEGLDDVLDMGSPANQSEHKIKQEGIMVKDHQAINHLHFPGQKEKLSDRQDVKRRMGLLYDRLATIAIEVNDVMEEIKILAAEWGSIVITVCMGENDSIRMVNAFARGLLDDTGLFRIDFTQLTPKLEAAISQVERAPGDTSIVRPRGARQPLATLSRKTIDAPELAGTAPSEPIRKSRHAEATPIPPRRRWGKKRGTIPPDQISPPGPWRFKLLDLTVTIAIGAVLITLLVPAINSAREAARRAQCEDHLKQLALACMNYESVNSVFPSQAQNPSIHGDPTLSVGWVPPLLQYMEQPDLFNSINFNQDLASSKYGLANSTAVTSTVSNLICPSESKLAPLRAYGTINNQKLYYGLLSYMGNYGGPGPMGVATGTIVPPNNWLIGSRPRPPGASDPGIPVGNFYPTATWGPVTIASITDGTFCTGLFSERMIGVSTTYADINAAGSDRLRSVIQAPTGAALKSGTYGALAMQQSCANAPGTTPLRYSSGNGQMWAASYPAWLVVQSYNHFGTPNQISCTNGTADVGQSSTNYVTPGGSAPPSSAHPGGVNCAFADGSVHFIRNTIAPQTWWGLGSRAGGEILSDDQY